jgi:hypothetical protein
LPLLKFFKVAAQVVNLINSFFADFNGVGWQLKTVSVCQRLWANEAAGKLSDLTSGDNGAGPLVGKFLRVDFLHDVVTSLFVDEQVTTGSRWGGIDPFGRFGTFQNNLRFF